MKYHLEVVGSAVVVVIGSSRYMFGAPESSQRIFNNLKKPLPNHYFFSSLKWKYFGGLPGLFLTLSDSKDEITHLHSSNLIFYSLAAMRNFLFRFNARLKIHSDTVYSDQNISVEAVELIHNDVPVDDNILAFVAKMFPASLKRKNDEISPDYNRIPKILNYGSLRAYICTGPTPPVKFDAEAAKKLGVPNGKIRRDLIQGKSITLDDGRIIHPEECTSPSKPPSTFLIITCPDQEYIKEIVSKISADKFTGKSVHCIVHILGQNILQDNEYLDWMNSFEKTTQHIVVSENLSSEMVLEAPARVQGLLNKLDPNIFPIYCPTKIDLLDIKGILPQEIVLNSITTTYQFEPKRELVIDSLCETEKKSVSPHISSYFEDCIQLRKQFQADSYKDMDVDLADNDALIVPLGTGAAIPSNSTLIKFKSGSILLDSGEGTLSQMLRTFGEDLDEELKNLTCVFISHMHADHHLGLFSVLSRIHELRSDKPLFIIAPRDYLLWLQESSDMMELGISNLVLVDSEHLRDSAPNRDPMLYLIINLRVCDCRPSKNVIEKGKGCDLLIHEATFDDELKQEAIDKKHSTTLEAVEVAKEMEAKNLLLTHFSQRYHKLPKEFDSNGICTGVAFDCMKIRLSEFSKVEQFTPLLRKLWPDIE